MRILLATSSFLPGIGGAEVAIHNLAEGLTSLGHAVAVFALQRRSGPEHERSYELFRASPPRGLGRTPFFSWWHARQIGSAIRRFRPEVIHAHFAWPVGHAAEAASSAAGLPVVLTSHGEDIQVRPEVGYGYRLKPALDRRIRQAVLGADALTAVGSSVYQEYLAIGADTERIFSVPNGIPWDLLSTRAPGARAALGMAQDRTVVLAVGRNHPKKGFQTFIRTIASVRREHPGVLGVIVGRNVPELRPLVQQLKAADHVRLIGELPPVGIRFSGDEFIGRRARSGRDRPSHGSSPAAMPDPAARLETYYHAADLYAMTSVVEAQGVVVLEAMAAGLPVVARRAPGAEELVRDGETGLLAEDREEALSSALDVLLGDPALRRRMGEAARAEARRFDRTAIAARYVEVYGTAAGLRRSRPGGSREARTGELP